LLLSRDFASACQTTGNRGRIINICSIEGYVATDPRGLSAYSATKTALRGLTVSLARELGPKGISVNGVVPGGVMHENLVGKDDIGATEGEIDATLEFIRARTSTGRWGTPDDIGYICLFLASDASDYIRGQTIIADGGYTIG
jgi:NAD(P)-dependent dehydrogenase (short-subunit alcohol dehydrogenase family)